jgi:hypothetical protein
VTIQPYRSVRSMGKWFVLAEQGTEHPEVAGRKIHLHTYVHSVDVTGGILQAPRRCDLQIGSSKPGEHDRQTRYPEYAT